MKLSVDGIKKIMGAALMLGCCMGAPKLVRADEHTMNMSQHKTPVEFEKLKQLLGTWTGTNTMHGKEMDYTVTYELTAGGSAVLERLFVGTPREMVSVYYPEGNHVVMTHYCMLGNQPHMTLQKVSGNTLSFGMQGTSGITSSKEAHMHHLNLTLMDPNHIKAEWTSYQNGKKNDVVVMELTRKS